MEMEYIPYMFFSAVIWYFMCVSWCVCVCLFIQCVHIPKVPYIVLCVYFKCVNVQFAKFFIISKCVRISLWNEHLGILLIVTFNLFCLFYVSLLFLSFSRSYTLDLSVSRSLPYHQRFFDFLCLCVISSIRHSQARIVPTHLILALFLSSK